MVVEPVIVRPEPVVVPTPAADSGLSSFAKKALVAAAVVGGLSGIGALGYVLNKPDGKSAAVSQPVQKESLYQYLEDEGEHLP